MSCNGCYDGCVEVTSDNCVKYLGPTIGALGITTGDTLASVEAAIIQYLQSALDGSGITWTIPGAQLCDLIDGFLPPAPYTLVDIINATFDAICALDDRVALAENALTTLNGNYDIDCLSGVNASSDTHDVLQATITALCDLSDTVSALGLSLNNYVLSAELPSLIQSYLDAITPVSTKHYLKMVPYTVMEYYGNLTGKFDQTGAGIPGTDWEKIYLCNGENQTPDKRGRIPIGTTTMGNAFFHPAVDPSIPGNPTYSTPGVSVQGSNRMLIGIANLPPHNHTAISTVDENPHSHVVPGQLGGNDGNHSNGSAFASADKEDSYFDMNSYGSKTNLKVNTTIGLTGNAVPLTIIPPVMACHYIMYIP